MKPFSISEHGEPKNGVVFLFVGWRTAKLFYLPGIKRMNQAGLKVILFIPDSKLISIGSQYQMIIDAVEYGNKKVADYTQQYADKPIRMGMGVSFGTLFITEITKRQPLINRLMLTEPFGDFDGHVRAWQSHKYFSKVIRSQPTDLEGSIAVLNQANPHGNIEKLADRRLMISYATNDSITHTAVAKAFIQELKNHNADLVVREYKGGHYTGILKQYAWLVAQVPELFKV